MVDVTLRKLDSSWSTKVSQIISPDYNFEQDRLDSLKYYISSACPLTNEIKANYARSGFYWTGNKEELKCNFCHLRIPCLQYHQTDPIELHLWFNSTCNFISRRPTKNVPIDSTLMDSFLPPKSKAVIYTGNIHGKYPEYQRYDCRLRTFKHWPSTNVDKETLARSGFFYLGESDKVMCFYCGLGLNEFAKGDVPNDEHRKFRRDCKFNECNV